MPRLLRRLYRLSLLLALAVIGILIELLVFPLIMPRTRRRIIRQWSRALLAACGLQLRLEWGEQAEAASLEALAAGRMLVSNHVSWLDIFAIDALATASFVAKSELRRWPVAGWLAAMAGTVFIERGRRHAVHQVIGQLRRRIREGCPVALFPEATTSPGDSVLPFHANLLEAAIAEAVEISPIALRYHDASGAPAAHAAYVGDTTFLQSLWMVLGARGLLVTVKVLQPVSASGRRRHELGAELRGLVSAGLASLTPRSAPGTTAAFPAASH